MKYRKFRDHMGRVHRVQVSREEQIEAWRYWTVFVATCVSSAAVLTAVSGILG